MTRNPVRIVKNPSNRETLAAEPATRPVPRPVTEAWLERVALHYLDRHGATGEMLRRMLARRVEARARARGEEPEAHAGLVGEVVARATRAGLVDDARFAELRLARLRRRGTSTRQAGANLAAKGLDRAVVDAALAHESEEAGGDVERAAAESYARRRRFGPHRPPHARADFRERDLAAMGRAGFPYAVALAVIDAGRGGPEDAG